MKKILFSLSLLLCSSLFAADADAYRDDSKSMVPMADLERRFAELQVQANIQRKATD